MSDYPDEKLNRDDEQFRKAQELLDEFREGHALSITRLSPTWCSGFLERITCYEDQPIDIDYIIGKWGGKRLRMRLHDASGRIVGGVDLNLSTWEPRRNGMRIRQDDDWRSIDEPVKIPAPPIPPVQQTAQPPIDITALMTFFQKQREQDMTAMRDMLQQALQLRENRPQSGVEEILDIGKKWKAIQGMFGSPAPVVLPAPPEQNDSSAMFSQITELIKVFKQPPPQLPRERHITGEAPQTAPPQQTLPTLLASMPNDQLTEILLTTLGSMPDDRRETVITQFLSRFDTDSDDNDVDDDISGETDSDDIEDTD